MVRKAVIDDVKGIHALIEAFAKRGIMLHRPENEIYDSVRDFFVHENCGKITGTCALHVCSADMGEIRSLAVAREFTGKGIGSSLVNACLDEARSIGLKKVFALTYQPKFFQKLKFRIVNKEVLPHKIWGDCIKCIKFPNCDEIAVIIEI